jgi:hypothetical protein
MKTARPQRPQSYKQEPDHHERGAGRSEREQHAARRQQAGAEQRAVVSG